MSPYDPLPLPNRLDDLKAVHFGHMHVHLYAQADSQLDRLLLPLVMEYRSVGVTGRGVPPRILAGRGIIQKESVGSLAAQCMFLLIIYMEGKGERAGRFLA
jgi:hypothetical protein